MKTLIIIIFFLFSILFDNNVDIKIYLAGTSTGAIVYTQRTGGVGVSTPPQITTDVYGAFKFYVDDGDYPLVTDQNFDVVAGGLTYPDLEIIRIFSSPLNFPIKLPLLSVLSLNTSSSNQICKPPKVETPCSFNVTL